MLGEHKKSLRIQILLRIIKTAQRLDQKEIFQKHDKKLLQQKTLNELIWVETKSFDSIFTLEKRNWKCSSQCTIKHSNTAVLKTEQSLYIAIESCQSHETMIDHMIDSYHLQCKNLSQTLKVRLSKLPVLWYYENNYELFFYTRKSPT
jgi:hypothetical protein